MGRDDDRAGLTAFGAAVFGFTAVTIIILAISFIS